ncbi:N-acyl-D-amino-acid deacylase family protein [Mycolicibacterium iranicum]|uniref:Amidohydrolase n=1 Tax=Mycolicibacterium iranicum TaxID=912594 RepID=A0A1X1W9Q0_MYCIR|nr:amidohydrolase family protein [Mycolicibacterium iranicum]ORV83284.1 amidohydrolase [Mycolicibacterium iranicum]
MLDVKITGGTVVDGTGADRFRADIGIKDGRIVEVRRRSESGVDDVGLQTEAAQEIDATGRVVAPGFVDVHTHYDGQVSWDATLEPSSLHGVTTVVSGNCGVGFAPVRPGKEQWLIELMEGVEDIPGSALAEGITWEWESFPEYLDAIGKRELAIDYGTQIAHSAVRGYVMGDRGARNEDATAEDIDAMARLVREGIEAGALGFSTSRTEAHRALDGTVMPGTYAVEAELLGLGRAMAAGGQAVFECSPAGTAGENDAASLTELDLLTRIAEDIDRPVSFTLLQTGGAPTLYREQLDRIGKAHDNGIAVYGQFAARPFGMLFGFPGYHAFTHRPTYRALKAKYTTDELAVKLAEPAVRAAILAEDDLPPQPVPMFDALFALVQNALDRIYPMGNPPDYEPTPDMTVAAIAERTGGDPLATLYDLMLEDNATAMLMLPFFNYADGNHDAIYEMMSHPGTVSGLSDGGAHCGLICDASYPTFLLTHWARDRHRGPKFSLETVVRKQTLDTATLFGLSDRGVIAVGKKADINVIDMDALRLDVPRMVYDLPAGGRRLIQGASGYEATMVSGVVTRRHGIDTGARPGRLLRGVR